MGLLADAGPFHGKYAEYFLVFKKRDCLPIVWSFQRPSTTECSRAWKQPKTKEKEINCFVDVSEYDF